MWATGQSGNQIMLDATEVDYYKKKYVDKYGSLEKGDYLLLVKPEWSSYANENPALKELSIRFGSSQAKIAAEFKTTEEAIEIASQGWAKLTQEQDK